MKPEPATGDFTSTNYPMTFQPPPNAFYCPLPDGWEGSDHGTTVFLARPKTCYGAGFPSSSRGFEPGDVPHIHVYYGYAVGGDVAKRCDAIDTAMLLGKSTSLCRETRDGMAVITAEGRYKTDSLVDLSISLVVRPDEVVQYLPTLKAMLATVHPCTAVWDEDAGHGKKKRVVYGRGPVCPAGQWY